MDVSDCAIIRQICMLEVTIARDTAAGKSTDKSVNALNSLLGSANLKPVQKKKEELSECNFYMTLQKETYTKILKKEGFLKKK